MFHVKQIKQMDELFEFVASQGIVLSTEQKQKLIHYKEELEKWGARQNLVSKKDLPHIVERHLLPSFLYLYFALQDRKQVLSRVLDLGTGAGLPGIVFSVYFNDGRITLLDSSRKKMLFLKHITHQLGLSHTLLMGRAEEIGLEEHERFSLITARAVASIERLLGLAVPLVRSGGKLLTLKGKGEGQDCSLCNARGVKVEVLEIDKSWKDYSSLLIEKQMIVLEF